MKIFITGITGFTGRYLLHHLKEMEGNSLQIFGLVRENKFKRNNGFIPISGDITDSIRLNEIIREISPDIIFHLAGLTHGSLSELLEVNVIGSENLLNSIGLSGINPRVIIIGSSAEYGYQGENPIREDAPVYPLSNYGVSKVAQINLSLFHYIKDHLNICIVRPFNVIGPGQLPLFVCGNIIHQITSKNNNGTQKIILHGADARRDFIDVRDVVRAYWMIASSPEFEQKYSGQVYNVGSEKAISVIEIITILETILVKPIHYLFEENETSYIPFQKSDCSKISLNIGWKPDISIEKSLYDMLTYERA